MSYDSCSTLPGSGIEVLGRERSAAGADGSAGARRRNTPRALDGLRTTNSISRTSQVVWRGILDLKILPDGRPLRILDIAAGWCDVVVGLAKLAARHNVAIKTHGCDIIDSVNTLKVPLT